jgi:hypothetical protein
MEQILLCGFGGLLYHVFPLLESIKNRDNTGMMVGEHPDFMLEIKKIRFWVCLIIYVGIACGFGYAYFINMTEVHGILEIHIGISTPLILRSMLNLKLSA